MAHNSQLNRYLMVEEEWVAELLTARNLDSDADFEAWTKNLKDFADWVRARTLDQLALPGEITQAAWPISFAVNDLAIHNIPEAEDRRAGHRKGVAQ